MSILDPSATTVQDVCLQALKESGAIGVGQTPLAENIVDAWARLQLMLQQWERKRWLVYVLRTYSIASSGAQTYTIGPGGQIDTGANSQRPVRIEAAYVRQTNVSSSNQVDYGLEVLKTREDYNKICIKALVSFPSYIYLETGFPLATLYPWPVAQANIYSIFVSVMEQLPTKFTSAAATIQLPWEYFNALVLNLAVRLRPIHGIRTTQGDQLPALAKAALNVLRQANTQVSRLRIPTELNRPGLYNVYSDTTY